jgi:hypothetical protein
VRALWECIPELLSALKDACSHRAACNVTVHSATAAHSSPDVLGALLERKGESLGGSRPRTCGTGDGGPRHPYGNHSVPASQGSDRSSAAGRHHRDKVAGAASDCAPSCCPRARCPAAESFHCTTLKTRDAAALKRASANPHKRSLMIYSQDSLIRTKMNHHFDFA